ncbi:MAG: serine/threonine protein kinase [Planctomycetales bacterium]|nr:serine/threonine protein kinase [Planctomycetales bacterium]
MEDSTSQLDIGEISGLTPEQSRRLCELLDQYLTTLERGESCSIEHLAKHNPDLAPMLANYVEKLQQLYGLAGGVAADTPVQLGDYRIIRTIGHGGMGIVYEAEQISLGRPVALKLLPLVAGLDSKQIERFKNESRAAGHLQHPHIVPIIGVGVHRGTHYYAMQFIDGSSVDQCISQQATGQEKRWSWQKCAEYGACVADALHEAHCSGIVHRDIKPSNLLLDKAGKIWVTDFGLARWQRSETSLTMSGDLVGTMRYMSPEQALGRNAWVDHRTDIYSLGITLYEMLALHPAIEGEGSVEILKAITDATPLSLRKLRPEMPMDLTVVIGKAMSKERDDRYETAQQLADDLRAVVAGRPPVAKPLSWSTELYRLARNHSRGLLITAGVLVVAVAGLLVSSLLIARKSRLAQENADKAEIYFRQAHWTVDSFGNDVAEELANIPGPAAAELRRQLLQNTLEYYQGFLATAKNNSRFQSELARTHSRMAWLELQMNGPAAALPHFEQAADLYTQLDTPEAQHEAANLNQLAGVYVQLQHYSQAIKSYERALELYHQLLNNDYLRPSTSHSSTQVDVAGPNDFHADQLEIELELTKCNHAMVLYLTRQDNESGQALNESLARLRSIHEVQPSDVLVQRGVAASLNNLALAAMQREDFTKAQELLLESLEWQRNYSSQSTNSSVATYEFGSTLNQLGRAYLAKQEFEQADIQFSQAVQVFRQLMAVFPGALVYQSDLALALNNLASVKVHEQDFERARKLSNEAIEIQSKVLRADPTSVAALARLSGAEYNASLAAAGMGQLALAIEFIDDSMSHRSQAVSASKIMTAKEMLPLWEHKTMLLLQNGNLDPAMEAVEAIVDLTKNDPTLVSRALSFLRQNLAKFPNSTQRDLELLVRKLDEASVN